MSVSPKSIASDFNVVFEKFETLLRYMAPGLVALSVAGTVGPIECKLAIAQLTGNIWLYITTSTVVGVLLYTTNTILLISWLWPLIVWIRIKITDTPDVFRGKNAFFTEAYFLLDKERWMRRASSSDRVRDIQRQITRWSSNNHFLYCSSISFITLPIITICREGYQGGTYHVYSIIIGLLLLVGATASDYRHCRVEMWATENFPGGADNSEKGHKIYE